MPRLTKDQKKAKRWKEYAQALDKIGQRVYFDCDGNAYFRGYPGNVTGRKKRQHER